MYAHIEGIVAEKTADYIVIDAGGVGYLMYVSGATLQAAPAVGERMKLFTVLNVREDAMELYGFYSREEKAMYERLKGVNGVGSRTALSILSALSVRDLSLALVAGDATALTRVPGIGKKTAQRLILELKDKVEESQLTGGGPAFPRRSRAVRKRRPWRRWWRWATAPARPRGRFRSSPGRRTR